MLDFLLCGFFWVIYETLCVWEEPFDPIAKAAGSHRSICSTVLFDARENTLYLPSFWCGRSNVFNIMCMMIICAVPTSAAALHVAALLVSSGTDVYCARDHAHRGAVWAGKLWSLRLWVTPMTFHLKKEKPVCLFIRTFFSRIDFISKSRKYVD